jgi:hypothetical protein
LEIEVKAWTKDKHRHTILKTDELNEESYMTGQIVDACFGVQFVTNKEIKHYTKTI